MAPIPPPIDDFLWDLVVKLEKRIVELEERIAKLEADDTR